MNARMRFPRPAAVNALASALLLVAIDASAQQAGTTCGANHVTEVESGALQLYGTDAVYPFELLSGHQALITVTPSPSTDVIVLLCDANISATSHCSTIRGGAGAGLSAQIGWISTPGNYTLVIETGQSPCGAFTIDTWTE